MTRIDNHPVLGPSTAETVEIIVDGQQVRARETDSVAVALWAVGQKVIRRSKTGLARGMYCGIGHCFECRLFVAANDGAETSVRSCLTPVHEGMVIRTLGKSNVNDAEPEQ